MSIFKRNFDKPGPGVPKNAPKKKGFARFLEIMGRDFGNIVKLNLLLALCTLPAVVSFYFCIISFFSRMSDPASYSALLFIGFALLSLLLSVVIGPAFAAAYKLLSKMLRDEPGFIFHDFKKEFKENFRSMVFPGIVMSIISASVVFAVFYYSLAGGQINFFLIAIYLFAVLVTAISFPYFFAQAPYLELSATALLKNSLLLAISNAPRSLIGAVLNVGLIVLQVLYLPLTLPVIIVFGIAFPMFLNLMLIWPKIDKTFDIDKTLKERREKELDETILKEKMSR